MRVFIAILIILSIKTVCLFAEPFLEPGVYIINGRKKPCTIEKWSQFNEPKSEFDSGLLVDVSFFIKRMKAFKTSPSSDYRNRQTKSILRREIAPVEISQFLKKAASTELLITYSLLGAYDLSNRQKHSTESLNILLSDLKRVGSACSDAETLFSRMIDYFYSEGLGDNSYLPIKNKDGLTQFKQHGKGLKLYHLLSDSDRLTFQKSFQKFFQD